MQDPDFPHPEFTAAGYHSVPNGQAPGSEKYAYEMKWLAALTRWLAAEATQHPGLIVPGDFNIVPQDREVHDPACLDWLRAREPGGARRAAGPPRCRPRRRISIIRAAGEVVQLGELPPGRLPAQ